MNTTVSTPTPKKDSGRADVLIIGAGASGGIAGKYLAEAGFSVVCLEQGRWMDRFEYPGRSADWEIAGRKQWFPGHARKGWHWWPEPNAILSRPYRGAGRTCRSERASKAATKAPRHRPTRPIGRSPSRMAPASSQAPGFDAW
ncbi:hypothetical protein BH23ACT5_BH23ACT5_02040 [soil metagenome]